MITLATHYPEKPRVTRHSTSPLLCGYYRGEDFAPSFRVPPNDMEGQRRSSRISKQLAIFLIGSDIDGRIFSEETKTVVLSRHGAGIMSQYKLSAEQELVIRRVDSGKEAEIRVVGQIGADGDTYIYGVALLDPGNFWGLEFAERTESEKRASHALLECSRCKSRETVDHSDLESDVFAINQSIMRHCKRCGSSTLWKQPSGIVAAEPEVSESLAAADPPEAAAPAPPLAMPPPPAVKPATPAAPQAPARAEDRRKHWRTRVRFPACVRRPGLPDDIVSCEDMSRGGLRFKSKKPYYARTMIEVAVPYSPGQEAIFVPGQIVYVHETPSEGIFHCGVAYIKSSR